MVPVGAEGGSSHGGADRSVSHNGLMDRAELVTGRSKVDNTGNVLGRTSGKEDTGDMVLGRT